MKVPPIVSIARVTILEASRRRLLLALVILTAIVIAGTGWGFSRLWTIRQGPSYITPTEVRLIASQLLILVSFMYAAVLALSSVLVASPALSGDVESGLALAVLSRPIRRSDMVLGKWLGLAVLVVLYAIGSGAGELAVLDLTTGYVPPDPVSLTAFIAAEGLVLMTVSLLLSTYLSGMTGGVIALVTYFMAWVGGIVGGIGIALQNGPLSNVGAFSKLLLPTDGLWRGAVYAMEPAGVRTAARAAGAAAAANPFFQGDPPATPFLAWVLLWLVAVLAVTVFVFRRREI